MTQEIASGTVVALDPLPAASAQWLDSVGNAHNFALDGNAILLQFSDEFGGNQIPGLLGDKWLKSEKIIFRLGDFFRDVLAALLIGGNATPTLQSCQPGLCAAQRVE